MDDLEQHEAQEVPTEEPQVAEDTAQCIRDELRREYAGRLARAELRAQAALEGVPLPLEFIDLLDSSKLVGEDGEPSTAAIALALQPFESLKQPKFPQLGGAGHNRSGSAFPTRSLDARHR